MKRLKDETFSLHTRLERDLDLLRPGLTSATYCDLLSRFYVVYSSWEPLAATLVSAEFPDWPVSRSRLGLLRQDLMWFGRAAESPAKLVFPGIDTLAAALGGMYVLEGSTLGSQILVKHFGRTLGVTPHSGGAFFNAYGAETATMWRSFGASVEEYVRRTQTHDTTVEGARTMFEVVHRSLCGDDS